MSNKIFNLVKKHTQTVWKFVVKSFTSTKKRLVKIYNFSREKYIPSIQKIKPWCKTWVDKVKKAWQKNKFSDKIINRLKSILKRLRVIILKHKKLIASLFLAIGYILFWMWFFGEKNVSVDDGKAMKNQEIVTKDKNNEEDNKNKKEKKKEFTEADLGTFWLEVNTKKVKIKAPIVNGIQDSDLDRGLGRHKTMAMPGEKGNLVISGHRWKFGSNPARTAFIDLDKLKKGDKVKVHYGQHIFEYEIVESGVVKPNDKGVKEILKKTDEPILTLYTCTPKYTSLKRLYYRAKLTK